MKRLISLLALLLAGPPLANAQFTATSGGMILDANIPTPSFGAFGPDFSFGALFIFNPLNTGDLPEGLNIDLSVYADTFGGLSDASANVGGVDLTLDFLSVNLSSDPILVPGPGTHTTHFVFDGEVRTSEAFYSFGGAGILTFDVVPTDTPDVVNIVSANYTIKNPLSEPSTTSLLLLGFAGLVFVGCRRRPEHENIN